MSRFTTRLTATVATAGALLATAALPAAAVDHQRHHHPQRSSVVLGSVQYNSPGRDNGSTRSLNAEWVTVTNTGRATVDLRGWTLSATDHHTTYRFGRIHLAGHASVRVHSGVGRDTPRDLYQDRRTYALRNASDTVTLWDSRGHLVDTESWGSRRDHAPTSRDSDDHRGDRDHRDHRGDRDRGSDHGSDRGSDHGSDRGSVHGTDHGSDHGSDHHIDHRIDHRGGRR